MKRLLFGAIVACLLMGVKPASAASVTWEAEFEFSASGGTLANGPGSLTLTLEDVVGGVSFLLQANLATGEFLSGLYLNFDPAKALISSANFTNQGGEAPESISFGTNAFKADGDGFFDILFAFDNAPPSDRFTGTDSLSYLITGVSVADFLFESVDGPEGKTGFPIAFRAQGLGVDNGGSGWFTDRDPDFDPDPIPEPTTLALFGLGLLGAGIARRRR